MKKIFKKLIYRSKEIISNIFDMLKKALSKTKEFLLRRDFSTVKEFTHKLQRFLLKKDISPDDIEFMPPVNAVSHGMEHLKQPVLLYTIAAFFIVFFIWAGFSEIDEVTRGEGKVIPSTQIQKVSHLEGGIIRAILVKEGDLVENGQVLINIDPTISEAHFQEGRDLYYRYSADVERLKAQAEGREFKESEKIKENAPYVSTEEMQRFRTHKQKLENEISIAQHEVEQKSEDLKGYESQLKQLEEQLELSKQELDILIPLVKKGLSGKLDLLKAKREMADVKGRIASTKNNITRCEAALQQAKQKLKNVPVNFRTEDLNELREAQNKLATAKEMIVSEGDRVSRMEVRSPVRGVIKQILVSTVGSAVRPGEEVIEIVPLEDTLLIEAQVKPSDIAYLRPGLPAIVKITAYDYSIYGGLKAELVRISADSIDTQEGGRKQSFYKVLIRTLNNKLSKSSKEVPIIPGMVATVDILTGKKTILRYLLKPIIRAKDTAFRER